MEVCSSQSSPFRLRHLESFIMIELLVWLIFRYCWYTTYVACVVACVAQHIYVMSSKLDGRWIEFGAIPACDSDMCHTCCGTFFHTKVRWKFESCWLSRRDVCCAENLEFSFFYPFVSFCHTLSIKPTSLSSFPPQMIPFVTVFFSLSLSLLIAVAALQSEYLIKRKRNLFQGVWWILYEEEFSFIRM
jgi:hypothetical protein